MSKYFTLPFNPLPFSASPHDFSSDNRLGPYAVETTQRFVYSTRYLMWDGRVYKYSNALAAVYSYHGARNSLDAALGLTVVPTAGIVSAGSRFINPTLANREIDDLAGGLAVMYDIADSIDNTCTRGIIGNDASATTTKIFLDYPLQKALTTGDYIELYENPYQALNHTTEGYSAWMGVPATSAGAGYKHWLQTFGPALISGGETIDTPTSDYRCLRWGSNAVLYTEASKANGQIAGYILNQGSSSIAGPEIMLMCSI